MNVAEIRKDFPILDQVVNGKPLVYLDNAATSQKPKRVIDAVAGYYASFNANVHRAIHALGERATAEYERSREKVARLIGARSERNIVFTNASEAVNLVAYAWGRNTLKEGDEIVLSKMEHHSNLIPWQQLGRMTGATVRYIELTHDGRLDMGSFDRLLSERTKIVAVTQASNVLGTINPVEEIVAKAKKYDSLVLVDGAQSVPHMKVDVQALGCDFFVFSGHKMLGPTGIGVLYGTTEALEAMEPFLFGGEMIAAVTYEKATWNEVPWKFEAGTPNVAGAIGLGAAVDYLESIGMDEVNRHERELVEYAFDVLGSLEEMTIYGPRGDRTGLVAFNYGNVHPHDLSTVLDQEGVAIRAGHHCAQPLMGWLNVPATARASFYIYNTKEEIDVLAAALQKTKEFFSNVPR